MKLLIIFLTCLFFVIPFIKAEPPEIKDVTLTPESGWVGIGGVISLRITSDVPIFASDCFMNGRSIQGDHEVGYVQYSYIVSHDDFAFKNGEMPLSCRVENEDGEQSEHIDRSDIDHEFNVNIDNELIRIREVSVSPSSGVLGSGETARIHFELNKPQLETPRCIVNNVTDIEIFEKPDQEDEMLEKFVYEGDYTLKEDHPAWESGELTLRCVFKDRAQNQIGIEQFNDRNTLAGDPSISNNEDESSSLSLSSSSSLEAKGSSSSSSSGAEISESINDESVQNSGAHSLIRNGNVKILLLGFIVFLL
eukprot:gb/GECH01012065.1/.p1 GENE.gb/GECH01012065.1/~~gb/GECH01012065.1/.p1  ORF type:complete len:307 (+),score=83.32 gb/GECH01012065.1/:1-921(+)